MEHRGGKDSGQLFTKAALKCQWGTVGGHRSISMGPRKRGGCLINNKDFPEESASEPRLKVARQSGKGDFTKENICCPGIQSKKAFSRFKDLHLQ